MGRDDSRLVGDTKQFALWMSSRSASSRARSSASWARTGRARRRLSGCCWACCIPRRAAPACWATTYDRDSLAIRAATGYLPGGIALYDTLDRRGDARLPGPPLRASNPAARRADRPSGDVRADSHAPVRDYSRGMRQKIGIIQALQHDPELAILDEPTEGLDPLMQRAFYDLLDERRKAGRTVFFSSHVLVGGRAACATGWRSSAQVRWWRFPTSPTCWRTSPPPCRDPLRRRTSGARRGRGGFDRRRSRRAAVVRAGGRRPAVPGRHQRRVDHRPDHRAGAPRGGLPGVLRRRGHRRVGRHPQTGRVQPQ